MENSWAALQTALNTELLDIEISDKRPTGGKIGPRPLPLLRPAATRASREMRKPMRGPASKGQIALFQETATVGGLRMLLKAVQRTAKVTAHAAPIRTATAYTWARMWTKESEDEEAWGTHPFISIFRIEDFVF